MIHEHTDTADHPVGFVAERPTQSVMLINSEMAKRILERNIRNRAAQPVTVETYRRDMLAGRWVYAADPIRFDTEGNLLDGQHRMLALASCEGLTLPFLVVRGLTAESQGVMDRGRKRLAYQQLAMNGVKNSVIVSAAVKVLIAWDEGLLFRDSKRLTMITSSQIQQWVEDHAEEVEFLQPIIPRIRATDLQPSIGAAAALRFMRIDPEATRTFFRLLAEGAGTFGHPIVTLDKRLQRIRREGLRIYPRDQLALVVLAWNAWRDGREITKFQRPRGGTWSRHNFPDPH